MGRAGEDIVGINDRKPQFDQNGVIRREDSLLLRERQRDEAPYEREMFLTCRIKGLIPASSAVIGGVTYLIYRTEGWFALTDSRCPRVIDNTLISDVEACLKTLQKTLKTYLLIPGHLLLDPTCVFVNHSGSIAFIYRPGGGEDGQDSSSAEEAEQAFRLKLNSLTVEDSFREKSLTGTAQSRWDDYLEAAGGEDFRSEEEEAPAAGTERKKRIDLYTIAVTLFLVGVMLAVFMILKSGVLDQLLQYIPVIGGG